MRLKFALVMSLGLAVCAPSMASALSVTSSNDSGALAGALSGSGITVVSTNLIGSDGQSGVFTDGLSSGIGIESGVILTTGSATSAEGPNSASGTSFNTSSGGSAQLEALNAGGFGTQDLNQLDIEFTTDSGALSFQYVFASEEYNEFVDSSFNDTFGFFVNDTNIALLPNGDPVSINNVNCGNPFSGVGPNCDSFNNNEDDTFDVEADGFTDVFVASISGLDPNATHTLSLQIADVSDGSLDSFVFIEGGSFTSAPTPPTPPTNGGGPSNPVPEPSAALVFGVGIAVVSSASRKTQIHS